MQTPHRRGCHRRHHPAIQQLPITLTCTRRQSELGSGRAVADLVNQFIICDNVIVDTRRSQVSGGQGGRPTRQGIQNVFDFGSCAVEERGTSSRRSPTRNGSLPSGASSASHTSPASHRGVLQPGQSARCCSRLFKHLGKHSIHEHFNRG